MKVAGKKIAEVVAARFGSTAAKSPHAKSPPTKAPPAKAPHAKSPHAKSSPTKAPPTKSPPTKAPHAKAPSSTPAASPSSTPAAIREPHLIMTKAAAAMEAFEAAASAMPSSEAGGSSLVGVAIAHSKTMTAYADLMRAEQDVQAVIKSALDVAQEPALMAPLVAVVDKMSILSRNTSSSGMLASPDAFATLYEEHRSIVVQCQHANAARVVVEAGRNAYGKVIELAGVAATTWSVVDDDMWNKAVERENKVFLYRIEVRAVMCAWVGGLSLVGWLVVWVGWWFGLAGGLGWLVWRVCVCVCCKLAHAWCSLILRRRTRRSSGARA